MKTSSPILLWADDCPGDREIARLIELELTERSLSVTRDPATPSPAAAVFITAHPTKEAIDTMEALLLRHPLPILCCYHDTEIPLPTGVILVERPFDVRRVCESLEQAAEPPKSAPSSSETLTLDPVAHTVMVGAEIVSLSPQEFALLAYLHRHRDRPVSREELYTAVWKKEGGASSNIVDVYIRYLRQKLDERFDTRRIRTRRGQGYQLIL